ncbi:MAG: pyruvate kinase, partial [Planctomycetota bacterium]|nr:pyruvate kinase [Planctomycetota bacterium]
MRHAKRHTKIVATLGPASETPDMIGKLIDAGVNVFRLNFSHGTHDSHRAAMTAIRAASRERGKEVAILQDLCGPKVRVGLMSSGAIELKTGGETIVTTDQVVGTPARFQTQYEALPRDVRPGEHILLDDGRMELEALSVSGNDIRCAIVRGGVLKDHKGMNLPGVNVSAPSVTEKDMDDLKMGIAEGVDFVALSFIRRAEDMIPVREALAAARSKARLIAKIEKPEAVDSPESIEAIVGYADGIMVARGDLGIEMPIQRVPTLQKRLIRLANSRDRYVITATQMLESMTVNAIPTRAEVSDVANAICDGSDAVMLSGETAVGVDPAGVVAMMGAIAGETEEYLKTHRPAWDWSTRLSRENPVQDALGHAALRLVQDLDVKAIAVHTPTGGTARFLSKSRPFVPILAFSCDADAVRRQNLFWGVTPLHDPGI